MMTREEAIQAVKEVTGMSLPWSDRHYDALQMAIVALEQPEQRWTPCSERLPDEARKEYWVCTDTGYQCQCRWTNNVYGVMESDRWGWSIFDTPKYSKVIAWMPLPEPYKKGE